MTNHWRDIQHADLVFINGGNPAEAHPVGFRWLMKAKRNGAKMIHTDPRFTRTSAVADIHVRTRTGTDVAYFGGLINYVLSNDLYHKEYVEWATNAAFVVGKDYSFEDGMFNGWDPDHGKYDPHGVGVREGRRRQRQGRHRPPAVGAQPDAQALQPLHAGDGQPHHRHPDGAVPRGGQDGRRDGQARQGDDVRLRRRHDPPHDGRAGDPLRRAAAAAPGQHRPARRRGQRSARPLQHPGQLRHGDRLGDPPGLPQDPGCRPAHHRRLRRDERVQAVATAGAELLRRQLRAPSWSAC